MHSTEQTLDTAIGELRCLRPDAPASLDELTALSVASRCIDELLHSCVKQLREDDFRRHHSWPEIAYALGNTSTAAVKQKYSTRLSNEEAGTAEHIASFWRSYADRFAWDFLPMSFLHALYTRWATSTPGAEPLLPRALTRRLRVVATTSGEWVYTRSRPGKLMNAAEPLLAEVPGWTVPEDSRALWGLRRVIA